MRTPKVLRNRIDWRQLRDIDALLLFITALLIGCGMVAIFSATRGLTADPFYYIRRQSQWLVVGVVAMCVVMTIDYRVYRKWVRVLYIGTLLMLVAVLVLAPTVMGAERWIVLGPLRLQPSELAKISIIITLAAYLEKKPNLSRPRDLIGPLLHVAIPTGLILLQPDLGTAMVFVAIALGMLFFAGARPKHLIAIVLLGLLAVVVAACLSLWGYLPILKEYQVRRLIVFLDPYRDPTGAGWNVIQSMVAIGSGGFFGKGLFGGSQTQLNFLPARHTDFIFSVIGEEFGFVGSAVVLILFGCLVLRLAKATVLAKDRFGSLVIGGVASMFIFHILVNVGMTLGVMPITGITLPFISQGGSSLLANLIAIGLVSAIVMQRRKIRF